MKIIELTETQFKNYSKLHSARSYMQTVEYAHYKEGIIYYKDNIYCLERNHINKDIIWCNNKSMENILTIAQ